MKVALLTTDNREQQKLYDLANPFFGTAIESLLEGFSELEDQVEIHVISCSRRKISSPEKIAPNIFFHQPVVPHIGWGRTAFSGCALAVRKLLKHIKPDIVHGQGTERDCSMSAVHSGFPNVLTIHGHMARIHELTGSKILSYYWLARKLESYAIRRTNGIVCITNYTQQRIAGLNHRTWILPNAVSSEFFEVNASATGKQILCVAHVCPWKRQVELIEALDELPLENRPELVFLGKAGCDDYSRRFTALVNERDWCIHAGQANRAELRAWMTQAAGLILPSIEDNCPMVILEAMAAGLPVAGAAIGGIPDLIKHGVTGLLFNPHEPQAIRAAIHSQLNPTSEELNMAIDAKEECKKRFHPKVIARQHMNIYREVLSQESHQQDLNK